MPEIYSGARLRRPKSAVALCAMLALAACQTSGSPGQGAGASTSAVEYITEIRSSHGLPALAYDAQLERAALKQSGYMAASGRMTHNTGWGKDFATRMAKGGIEGVAAENLAHGRMDLNRLFEMWMNSQGHRRNMLDPRLTRFGLAYVQSGKGSDERYWTLVVSK